MIGSVALRRSAAAAALAGTLGAGAAAAGMREFWKDGFRFRSPDGRREIQVGGRLMVDWAFDDTDPSLEAARGKLGNGSETRRARFFVSGKRDDGWRFKLQYDYASGTAKAKDLYIGHDDGTRSLLLGNQKNFFGLEQRSSSKYVTYVERGIPEIFVPVRGLGAGLLRRIEGARLSVGVGLTRASDEWGISPNREDTTLSLRLHGQPVDRGKDGFLHLGLALARREAQGTRFRYRARPKIHQGARIVDTRSFAAAEADVLGLEAAWIHGPFSIQGEWARASHEAPALGNPEFEAWYLSLSCFLTGESRPYDRRLGAFKRLKPRRKWNGRRGGAVELAARYARLDLQDGAVRGGVTDDVTFGINWYLNPNVRLKLDYIRPERDGVGGADIVAFRIGVDF